MLRCGGKAAAGCAGRTAAAGAARHRRPAASPAAARDAWARAGLLQQRLQEELTATRNGSEVGAARVNGAAEEQKAKAGEVNCGAFLP